MDYIEVEIKCPEELKEILMAKLADQDYDGFLETNEGFLAYIAKESYSKARLLEVLDSYAKASRISFSMAHVRDKNWNEEWEKNYDPVIIEGKCLIRASFHPSDPNYPYEIVINPRMSFGTGHHETTSLMIAHQLAIDHQGKDVLDIGCGTGILSIMASKSGASRVLAIDNNEWAYENAKDNISLNGLQNVEVRLGSFYDTGIAQKFDFILANINRNVLLEELADYIQALKKGGGIVISGFYEEDEKDLEELLKANGCELRSRKTNNRWSALYYKSK